MAFMGASVAADGRGVHPRGLGLPCGRRAGIIPGVPAVSELERIVAQRLDAEPLFAALLELLKRDGLRFDGACWHVTDPLTGLFTRTGAIGALPGDYRTAVELELFTDDVAKLAELGGRRVPVASLVDETAGLPEASPRWREMIAPDGHRDELRAVFADPFGRWGSIGLFRADVPFDAGDRALLGAVVPLVAQALRVGAAMARASGAAPVPGVLVLDGDDRLETIDPTARTLLGDAEAGLPGAVHVVIARARRAGGPARGRMLTADGWLLLDATPLEGGPGRVAVVVQAAPSASLVDVRLRAAGLSAREREVALCVLRGETTAQIAGTLFVSPWTVQDHLKAIFEKTGVRSRRELVAALAL
jgi:DNA-binding CsgD family transcriptional regulator